MKIPVFCSLLPTELFIGMGHEVHFVEAGELLTAKSNEYRCAFHENLCSYSKSLYEYLAANEKKFGLIVVPTSCDALKKLFNALCGKIQREKIHLLDVPQNKGEEAVSYFAAQLETLKSILLSHDAANFKSHPSNEKCGITSHSVRNGKVKIGILGANVPLKVLEKCLSKFDFEPVYLNHCLVKSKADSELKKWAEADIKEYARLLLEQNSCPRTNDYGYKEELIKSIEDYGVRGLIVNSVKFCDFQHFDYKFFKEHLNLPILILEHEFEANYEGQIMTRLEAFFESIKGKVKAKVKVEVNGFFVGIDSGSHATKLVCIDKEGKIVARHMVPTGTSVKKSVEDVIEKLTQDGIGRRDIVRMVATGYGRNNVDGADEVVTEISCHATGAFHVLGKGGTIIDIGGQDSKAIRMDDNGKVVHFAMNDKCAAGTGRFLEVMAHKLETSLEDFAKIALRAESAVPVSSMCSVFAESEVISLIASGKSKEEIAKGIHQSIAERTASLSRRINGAPPYYMAGGVSKNMSLVRELEISLGSKIHVIDKPQFTGALGAALFALKGA